MHTYQSPKFVDQQYVKYSTLKVDTVGPSISDYAQGETTRQPTSNSLSPEEAKKHRSIKRKLLKK